MDRTYQRQDLGQYGFACKVVPEFSEKEHKTFKGCLHRRGTARFPVKTQSIVPSPSYFKVDFPFLVLMRTELGLNSLRRKQTNPLVYTVCVLVHDILFQIPLSRKDIYSRFFLVKTTV